MTVEGLQESREARIDGVPIMPDGRFAREAWCPRWKFCSQGYGRVGSPTRDHPKYDTNAAQSARERTESTKRSSMPTTNTDVVAKRQPANVGIMYSGYVARRSL